MQVDEGKMRKNEAATGRNACFCVAPGWLRLAGGGIAPTQDAETRYVRIGLIEQYLMDREAEIVMARSAVPSSISTEAEVLVLGRKGYETAVKGKNGFVCIVERSWMSPFDDPKFFNPNQSPTLCLNPPAARIYLRPTLKATALALSGIPKAQMFRILKAAYENKDLPLPGPGSMYFIMSKQQYFGRKDGNADLHTMFWFPQEDHVSWRTGLPGSSIYIHHNSPDLILTFVISVSLWSDGTSAPKETN